jgi:hypothetical protein
LVQLHNYLFVAFSFPIDCNNFSLVKAFKLTNRFKRGLC